MKYDNKEVNIVPGFSENFYWIEKSLNVDEVSLLQKAKFNLVQGSVNVISHNENRFSVIKIGDNYFCMEIPEQELPLDADYSEEISTENN